MILLGLLTCVAGLAGLVAWHMQRPDPERRILSFARFLPDPPPAAPEAPRFALRLPWSSAGFWLRLLSAGLLVAALVFPWAEGLRLPGSAQVGLRVVLDVSASMRVASGEGTRLDKALTEVAALQARAREAAAGGAYCDELIAVGGAARAALSPIPDRPALQPEAMGADPARLVEAARLAPGACLPTQVVILTDQPAPMQLPTLDGPALDWLQVGVPAANLGLRTAIWRGPDLLGGPARLLIEVLASGPVEGPVEVMLSGPGGSQTLTLDQARDRDDLWRAEVISPQPGDWSARLSQGGAFTGDDRLDFTLPQALRPGVDWRLAAPRPAALVQDGAGLLVAPLGADPTDRPALLTYPGWDRPGAPTIGAFLDDPLVAEAMNLDLLEAHLPAGYTGPLPPGFQPVLSDAKGGVILARRADPPGLILPEPLAGRGDEAATLSQILFFSGLAELIIPAHQTPRQAWIDADGAEIPLADRESDTGRALALRVEPDFAPAPPSSSAADPLWPDIALAVLGLLLAERLLVLWRRRHAL